MKSSRKRSATGTDRATKKSRNNEPAVVGRNIYSQFGITRNIETATGNQIFRPEINDVAFSHFESFDDFAEAADWRDLYFLKRGDWCSSLAAVLTYDVASRTLRSHVPYGPFYFGYRSLIVTDGNDDNIWAVFDPNIETILEREAIVALYNSPIPLKYIDQSPFVPRDRDTDGELHRRLVRWGYFDTRRTPIRQDLSEVLLEALELPDAPERIYLAVEVEAILTAVSDITENSPDQPSHEQVATSSNGVAESGVFGIARIATIGDPFEGGYNRFNLALVRYESFEKLAIAADAHDLNFVREGDWCASLAPILRYDRTTETLWTHIPHGPGFFGYRTLIVEEVESVGILAAFDPDIDRIFTPSVCVALYDSPIPLDFLVDWPLATAVDIESADRRIRLTERIAAKLSVPDPPAIVFLANELLRIVEAAAAANAVDPILPALVDDVDCDSASRNALALKLKNVTDFVQLANTLRDCVKVAATSELDVLRGWLEAVSDLIDFPAHWLNSLETVANTVEAETIGAKLAISAVEKYDAARRGLVNTYEAVDDWFMTTIRDVAKGRLATSGGDFANQLFRTYDRLTGRLNDDRCFDYDIYEIVQASSSAVAIDRRTRIVDDITRRLRQFNGVRLTARETADKMTNLAAKFTNSAVSVMSMTIVDACAVADFHARAYKTRKSLTNSVARSERSIRDRTQNILPILAKSETYYSPANAESYELERPLDPRFPNSEYVTARVFSDELRRIANAGECASTFGNGVNRAWDRLADKVASNNGDYWQFVNNGDNRSIFADAEKLYTFERSLVGNWFIGRSTLNLRSTSSSRALESDSTVATFSDLTREIRRAAYLRVSRSNYDDRLPENLNYIEPTSIDHTVVDKNSSKIGRFVAAWNRLHEHQRRILRAANESAVLVARENQRLLDVLQRAEFIHEAIDAARGGIGFHAKVQKEFLGEVLAEKRVSKPKLPTGTEEQDVEAIEPWWSVAERTYSALNRLPRLDRIITTVRGQAARTLFDDLLTRTFSRFSQTTPQSSFPEPSDVALFSRLTTRVLEQSSLVSKITNLIGKETLQKVLRWEDARSKTRALSSSLLYRVVKNDTSEVLNRFSPHTLFRDGPTGEFAATILVGYEDETRDDLLKMIAGRDGDRWALRYVVNRDSVKFNPIPEHREFRAALYDDNATPFLGTDTGSLVAFFAYHATIALELYGLRALDDESSSIDEFGAASSIFKLGKSDPFVFISRLTVPGDRITGQTRTVQKSPQRLDVFERLSPESRRDVEVNANRDGYPHPQRNRRFAKAIVNASKFYAEKWNGRIALPFETLLRLATGEWGEKNRFDCLARQTRKLYEDFSRQLTFATFPSEGSPVSVSMDVDDVCNADDGLINSFRGRSFTVQFGYISATGAEERIPALDRVFSITDLHANYDIVRDNYGKYLDDYDEDAMIWNDSEAYVMPSEYPFVSCDLEIPGICTFDASKPMELDEPDRSREKVVSYEPDRSREKVISYEQIIDDSAALQKHSSLRSDDYDENVARERNSVISIERPRSPTLPKTIINISPVPSVSRSNQFTVFSSDVRRHVSYFGYINRLISRVPLFRSDFAARIARR